MRRLGRETVRAFVVHEGMRVDPSRTNASLTRAQKNIRFGIARGLTQMARAAAERVNATMGQRFDRPTPFTQKAAGFLPATRDRLTATVFVKDVQAGYLRIQETGGARKPEPGRPVVIPVAQRTNAYGNLPRGAIARLRARKDTFAASGRGVTAHLKPGIYQRERSRKRSGGGKPKLLVAFRKAARYARRFGMRETVTRFVDGEGRKILAQSIAAALRTAR